MLFEIGVFKNFAISTWKKPVLVSLNKVADLKPCQETPKQVFSCKYCEIFGGFKVASYTKLNERKYNLFISGHMHELLWANIWRSKTWKSEKQKLLRIVIDRNLRFDEYILSQCKKTGRKLSELFESANPWQMNGEELWWKPLLNLTFLMRMCCNQSCMKL